jgi:hypothetical protein
MTDKKNYTTIRKIVFLVQSHFCKRDFERFGVQMLLDNGFEVEVWDFASILNKELVKKYASPDFVNWPGHRTFSDKREALKKIKAMDKSTFAILHLPYRPQQYPFFRAISASAARYAIYNANAFPPDPKKDDGLSKLRSEIKQPLSKIQKKLIDYIFIRTPFNWLGVRPADLFLAGGEGTLRYTGPVDKSTEALWMHTMDYDVYLKERSADFTERPIAVFLDGYIPFHPDEVAQGVPPLLSADRYYPMVNRFLRFVEDRLGLEVIIAAHPRSDYETHPDYFERRKCVKGQTFKLVRECRLVMAHASTALTFTNLFYKPLVLLTSRELDKTVLATKIRIMAGWFGKDPIYMDDIDGYSKIDWEKELIVDKSVYDRYRQSYIKKDGSPDVMQGQILVERLKKGFHG